MTMVARAGGNIGGSSSVGTQFTPNVPALTGIVDGDAVLVTAAIGTDKTASLNTPAGWAKLYSRYHAASTTTLIVWTGLYVAAGWSNPTMSWTGSTNNGWILQAAGSNSAGTIRISSEVFYDSTVASQTVPNSQAPLTGLNSISYLAVCSSFFAANESLSTPANMTAWQQHTNGVPSIRVALYYANISGPGTFTPADTTETATATSQINTWWYTDQADPPAPSDNVPHLIAGRGASW